MRTCRARRQRGQSKMEYSVAVAALVVVAGTGTMMGLKLRDTYAMTSKHIGEAASQQAGEDGTVLFSDDFQGDASNWTFTRGGRKIRLADGQLRVVRRGERRAFAKGSTGTDYTIRTQATLAKGNGYGIFFRSDGAKKVNGYTFQYDPGYRKGMFLLRKWVNGREKSPFAIGTAPPGFRWAGTTREVEVKAQGGTFTVMIDGRAVVTGFDDTYVSGMAGIRAWDRTLASFDSFEVTAGT